MPQLLHAPSEQFVDLTQAETKEGLRISISDIGAGGSGGGGGKGSKGSASGIDERPNTIRSKAYVNLLLAISEGEIYCWGANDYLQCIYLDETPIKNVDGSLNFKDMLIDVRVGTPDQTYIGGVMSAVEREVNVGTQLKKSNGAVTRTISDATLDAVRLRFGFSGMREVSEDGKTITGSKVEFSIKLNGVEVQRAIVSEKATSAFEVNNFYIPLTGSAPWNVSVERITADSTTERVTNDMYWQGYTEIINTKLRYPNTALLFIQADAEQFSSIPKAALKLYGMFCLTPHNYDPFQRSYSGMFNGSLVPKWTNNPVWILYDLLTNNRYGLGDRINRSLIDVTTFYSAAQYCDELVPDGFGGLEPRFVFNAYITTEDEAHKLLEMVCAVFRAMPYSYGGSVQLSQDRPKQPTKIFSPSNVISEDDSGKPIPPFNYSASDLDTRYSAAYVTWSNPNNFYKDDIVYYENSSATLKYGFNKIDARGFGVTSRGQAYRYAKWLVEVAQNITNTVTFKVGSEGDLVNVGEVFTLADPLKMQQRFYGRLMGVNYSYQVTLDYPITLDPTKTYQITLWNPATNQTETRTVDQAQSQPQSLVVTQSFSFTPETSAVFQLQSNVLKPKPFQCVSVVENGHQFEITGIEYYAELYDSIDKDTNFTKTNYAGFADVNAAVQPPTNLTITESLYQAIGSAGVKARIEVGWTPSTSPWIRQHLFEYKKLSDLNFTQIYIDSTSGNSWTLNDVEPAEYNFKVTAINGLGNKSSALAQRKSILGLSAPPAPPTELQINYYADYILLTWNPSPDLDVRIGGTYKVKQTNKTSSVSWSDGLEVATVSGAQNSLQLPLLDGAFLIKSVDSQGVQSLDAAIIITKPSPQLSTHTNFLTLQESPTFAGAKEGTKVETGYLKLTSGNLFDTSSGDFDSGSGLFDNGGNTSTDTALTPEGLYYFSQETDLGAAYTVRIIADFSAFVANENVLFDSTPGNFDSGSGSFEGTGLDKATSVLQIAQSQDGATFSDWQDFMIGDYFGWKFKFRVKLKSLDRLQNSFVQTLRVRVNLPERFETGTNTTSASGSTVITFGKNFRFTPKVSLTILNASSGDYVESVTPTSSNFTVVVKNTSGTVVSRNISWIAQGFGRGV